MNINSEFQEKGKSFPEGFNYYVVGFIDGEGSFFINFSKVARLTIGIETVAGFAVGQKRNQKNYELLTMIRDFFDCGAIRNSEKDDCYKYESRSLSELREKIIPFFQKHKLLGNKIQDFDIFCKICSLMAEEQQHNIKGLISILKLASKMNNASKKRKNKLRELQSFLEKKAEEQFLFNTLPENF